MPLPLNTDPLNYKPGVLGKGFHGDIGGPPLEIQFTGAPASRNVFTPLLAEPFVDVNGNAVVDDDETILDQNYIELVATGHFGLINSISVGCRPAEQKDCAPEKSRTFLNNVLIADIHSYDAETEGVYVDIHSKIFYGTSTKMYANALGGLLKLELDSGLIMLRTRSVNNGPIPSRIISGGVDETGQTLPPIFEIDLDVYLDAPYLHVLQGLSGTSMHSLKTQLKIRGPVTFLEDGRIELHLSNAEDIVFIVDMYVLEREALETLMGKNAFSRVANLLLSVFTFSPNHKIGSIELTTPKDGILVHLTGESPQ
jgi:hypothetical protein